MTVVPIQIVDLMNPIELQQWFDEHPERNMDNTKFILIQNLFYIIY
jgi:hypothetical protein